MRYARGGPVARGSVYGGASRGSVSGVATCALATKAIASARETGAGAGAALPEPTQQLMQLQ